MGSLQLVLLGLMNQYGFIDTNNFTEAFAGSGAIDALDNLVKSGVFKKAGTIHVFA